MKQFVPQEKLSKKVRKEINAKQRLTWGLINPATQKIENKKAYNRKKVQKGMIDSYSEPFAV